ncbi:MAG: hypothetical protein NZ750_08895 [Anaerolineae bacterium]|nr:hypothetical protein [Anaerolineae bacterium]MDW8171734.1 hypothetical protein [Anaerolineae bacterium]
MSYALALERLASLEVVGVATRLPLAAQPAALWRAQLPALLLTPLEVEGQPFFRERSGQAFQASSFDAGPHLASAQANHLLFVAPAQPALGSHLPRLAHLIDSYLLALKDNPTLGGALARPARVHLEARTLTWGSVDYLACVFRHHWELAL